MAKTTEEPEAPKGPKSVFANTGVYPEGEHKDLRWGELPIDGTTYRLRQVTVTEGDDNYDASLDATKRVFNPRLNSRLNLASTIVSPPTSVDDMGRWSNLRLLRLLAAYDELNSLPAADIEGNG